MCAITQANLCVQTQPALAAGYRKVPSIGLHVRLLKLACCDTCWIRPKAVPVRASNKYSARCANDHVRDYSTWKSQCHYLFLRGIAFVYRSVELEEHDLRASPPKEGPAMREFVQKLSGKQWSDAAYLPRREKRQLVVSAKVVGDGIGWPPGFLFSRSGHVSISLTAQRGVDYKPVVINVTRDSIKAVLLGQSRYYPLQDMPKTFCIRNKFFSRLDNTGHHFNMNNS